MKVILDSDVFFQLWKDKEKLMGRPLTLTDASKATGLAPETIRNIRDGKTTRLDAPVIAKICRLFDIPPGPVPFIVYNCNNFFKWLKSVTNHNDLIGDFARDTIRKSREPGNLVPENSVDSEDWINYLREIARVDRAVLAAFKEAWEEWSGESVNLPTPS